MALPVLPRPALPVLPRHQSSASRLSTSDKGTMILKIKYDRGLLREDKGTYDKGLVREDKGILAKKRKKVISTSRTKDRISPS